MRSNPLTRWPLVSAGILAAMLLASHAGHGETPAVPGASLTFTLPKASFVTLVIDDAGGNRVCNLVAERKYAAGKHRIDWDGRNDAGAPVPAGTYHWRGLYRDELKLEYQFSVYQANARPPWFTDYIGKPLTSGWLSDHHPPCAVAAIGDKVFVGAIVCENGQDLMALDAASGRKLWGVAHPGNGAGASVLCADERWVYGAGEAQWAGDNAYVYRVDPQTYRVEMLWHHQGRLGLRGIAARDGKLYVASDLLNKLFVLDAGQKTLLREIPLQQPGGVAFSSAGKLLAISGRQVVVVQDDGTTQPLVGDHLTRPNRLAVGADGTIYVSDGPTSWYRDASLEANTLYGDESVRFSGDNQVKVFDAAGKFLRVIGKEGGRKPGPYDPQAMRCPVGLALDKTNHLWVAEYDMLPKRLSVWDAQTGQLVKEYLGAHKYGGGGALDPGDRTTMIYDGMLFKLDWQTGTWKLTDTIVDIMNVHSDAAHTFGGYGDWPTRIVRYQGEAFYVGGRDGAMTTECGGTIWKRRGDAFLPVAYVGGFNPGVTKDNEPNTAHYLYQRMVDVLGPAPPGRGVTDVGGPPGKWNGFLSFLMMWSDANGDGIVQPAEVNFSDRPHYWLAVATVGPDLSVYVRQLAHRGRTAVWRLPLVGLNEQGAPRYDAARMETVLEPQPDSSVTNDMMADGTGRVFVFGRPLYGVDTKAKTRWTYPNPWPGLGEGAPRAAPGLIVGGWGLRGAATVGGDIGSLLAVNSNFGEWYLLTGDGLFVSTLFGDTRTAPLWGTHFPEPIQRGTDVNGASLGQESFYGWMGRTSDGQVYIVAGHPHVSIVKIGGLDSVKRLPGGTLRLSAAAAGVAGSQAAAGDLVLRPYGPGFETREPSAILKSGAAEVARVWLAYDGNNLYAHFKVRDASPLLNSGTNPKLLFKTGDSVDLQLGLDPDAVPQRTTPVPGDIRLLLTKTAGGATGILYRYKTATAATPERFWSPTGEVLVDKIEVLEQAQGLKIEAAPDPEGYVVTAVLPWKVLAGAPYSPPAGGVLRGDVGVLFSDPHGDVTVERIYHFNKNTNIVADVPSEIRLHPEAWGTWKLVVN